MLQYFEIFLRSLHNLLTGIEKFVKVPISEVDKKKIINNCYFYRKPIKRPLQSKTEKL